MQEVAVPAVGEVHREIPFHALIDSESLSKDSDVTSFFVNPRKFRDGSLKSWPHESNLEGVGNCLPQGQRKDVRRLSLHVDRCLGEQKFEVEILTSLVVTFKAKIVTGYAGAVYVCGPVVENVKGTLETNYTLFEQPPEGEEPRGVPHLLLMPMEQWEVRVRAPREFRGRYARVMLHGPLLVHLL